MKFKDIKATVIQLCKDEKLNFQEKSNLLQSQFLKCTKTQLLEHLEYAGVIPECFDHDSTEEKLFAKYCDALLAKTWCELGLVAHPIAERADAADVHAKGNNYSIVGDAKAFRLSRTAKNQKDFKVEALNQWRKGADFACLVCPIYQYPNRKSQIYGQAIRFNVLLLSYTHLCFMLRHRAANQAHLDILWGMSKSMLQSNSAETYWQTINKKILNITGAQEKNWIEEQKLTTDRLSELAEEQIIYWQKVKEGTSNLPVEVLRKKLIKALKIDTKVDIIRSYTNITIGTSS